MKVSILYYVIIFAGVLIGVLVVYTVLRLLFKFIRWIFRSIGSLFSRKNKPKKTYTEKSGIQTGKEKIKIKDVPGKVKSAPVEKRKNERRGTERRKFNRGFFVRKGFFGAESFKDDFKDKDYIDRRKGDRRDKNRRKNDKPVK
jgi:hypothetical protein